jgi:fatty-acyl-CoA synthase/feruloyl-CoA synthase
MPTLHGLIGVNANRVGARAAVIDGDRSLSWSQLRTDVARYASSLADQGVSRGDRVALVSHNAASVVTAAFAALHLGAIVVFVNTRLAQPELTHVLADCDPRVVIAEPALIARSANALDGQRAIAALGSVPGYLDLGADAVQRATHPGVDVGEGDDAVIIYTSGTAGMPKGALHTHHSAIWAALSQICAANLRDGERFLHIAPLHHAGGFVFLTAITLLGGTHIMLPDFDPATTLAEITRSKATCMLTVPTVLQMLLRQLDADDAGVDVRSWTRTIVGGAPTPGPTLDEMFNRLPHVRITQMCGQTESGPAGLFSTDQQMRQQPTASGHQAEPFIEARVVDQYGDDVAPGDIGELIFRGESVMKEYFRRPSETAAVIRDGWLHTGDLLRAETDGCFVLVDRMKDMIISGGRNVYSAEVEQAVDTHPDVRECAVIARPDPLWGESIVAVVNPKPGCSITLDDLREHCRPLISDYKLPHALVLAELPRNANGKVQKAVLRSTYGTMEGTRR